MALSEAAQQWRHLKYLSTRLAIQNLNLTELNRRYPFGGVTPSFQVQGVTVETQVGGRGPVNFENPFEVAQALDQKLEGTYLTLEDLPAGRRIAKGDLIKAKLLMQPAQLQIQHYELVHPSSETYFVQAFTSVDRVPGLGRTFVGLVGSQYNLIALPGEGLRGARSASDARGLYDMIQYTKEVADVNDINADYLSRERKLYESASAQEIFDEVASAFNGFAIQAVPLPYDVLFEVHHVGRDVNLHSLGSYVDGSGHVDLALFGAPICIREAIESPVLSSNSILETPGMVQEEWEAFDVDLRAMLHDEHHQVVWRPRSADEWRHFCQWVAAWARRVGPAEQPMVWHPPRHQIGKWGWGGPQSSLAYTGLEGWPLHDWNTVSYLITRRGELYEISVANSDLRWIWDRRPKPIVYTDDHLDDVAQTAFRTLTRWLMPFSRDR